MKASDEIIKVLEYLSEKIGVTVNWTEENVLPYIQILCEKYVRWEIWMSATNIIFLLAMLMFSIWCMRMWIRWRQKDENQLYHEDFDIIMGVMSWIVVIAVAIGCICFIPSEIQDIITCCCFPELQLCKYITGLMK